MEKWQKKVCGRSILNAIKRIGYSYKKNILSSEKGYWGASLRTHNSESGNPSLYSAFPGSPRSLPRSRDDEIKRL